MASASKMTGAKIWLIIACIVLIGTGVLSFKVFETRQLTRLIDQGNAYLGKGDFQLALDSFTKAEGKDTGNAAVLVGKAKSLIGLGHLSQAEEILAELIQTPQSAECYQLLAELYLDGGHISKALDVLGMGAAAEDSEKLAHLHGEILGAIQLSSTQSMYFAGEEVEVHLLFSRGDTTVTLTPQWSVNAGAVMVERGFALINMAIPGEVKVTAQFGEITREKTLVFTEPVWAEELADFVTTFNYPYVIPEFSHPNELGSEILIMQLFNWIQRTGDEWEEIISHDTLQAAAVEVFGPGIKKITPQSVWLIEWNPHQSQYEIIPTCFGGAYMTYILEARDIGDQGIVDAVHVRYEIAWEGDEDQEMLEVYDEKGNFLGKVTSQALDKLLNEETLLTLPVRRHVFDKTGNFRYAQSRVLE